jgi:hypothetical protein
LTLLRSGTKELRTFLTDKAQQIQNAFKVVAVEMRIGGTDVRLMLENLAARAQKAQTDLVTTIQPDNVVLDERDLTGWTAEGEQGTGMAARDRTAASVQEVFNASETINARFLRLQEQLVEAENDGNQELVDQISTELDRLTEEGLKQAKNKQLSALSRRKKMPFQSEKQRKYLWAKEPEVAKKWAKETPKGKKLPQKVKPKKK